VNFDPGADEKTAPHGGERLYRKQSSSTDNNETGSFTFTPESWIGFRLRNREEETCRKLRENLNLIGNKHYHLSGGKTVL
jgi:hypothetical protein